MNTVLASAVTRAPRIEVIDEVRAAASSAGAWLVDFEHFSNLATVLRFEVSEGKLAAVRDALAGTRAPATFARPSAEVDAEVDAEDDVMLVLRIDFINTDAPLVLEKPIRT